MSNSEKTGRSTFRRLVNYFLQGLLYIAPIGLTIYIIYSLFGFLDGLLHSVILDLFGIYIPGLGLIAIVLLITLLGYIGQTVIAHPIKRQINWILKQTPILQTLYSSIKDFFEAFVGKDKKFNHPVLVKVNQSANLEKIGFITQTDLSELKIKDKVAVYFPHSYAFSGELFVVPTENVTPLDMSSREAMKFVLTGGITKITEE